MSDKPQTTKINEQTVRDALKLLRHMESNRGDQDYVDASEEALNRLMEKINADTQTHYPPRFLTEQEINNLPLAEQSKYEFDGDASAYLGYFCYRRKAEFGGTDVKF